MDLDSIPVPFREAYTQSVLNLNQLRDTGNITIYKQADVQNLFNCTQIQQNQIFEDILALLPSLQINAGQQDAADGVFTRLNAKWRNNLELSRNVMQIIDSANVGKETHLWH